ncbi:MAG: hypothetical protein AAGG09_02660 [Pseudomonadota bacterium]
MIAHRHMRFTHPALASLARRLMAGGLATLLSCTITWAEAAPKADLSPKEIYRAAEALRDTDPAAAFRTMEGLAGQGEGRALARLAYYHLKGIGTAADPHLAEGLYAEAVAAGHARSLLSRAKLLMRLGETDSAVELFDAAVAHSVKGAAAERASAHAQGRLGAASAPDRGWRELHRLAASGDTVAELALLKTAVRRREPAGDEAALLSRVAARADAGDGRAAETLLRYLRGPGRGTEGALEARVALVEHAGLRPVVEVEERLHLSSQLEPAYFWLNAERLIMEAPAVARARALIVTAQINRNAYLWVAEDRFRALGHDVRGRRGYLTASRIRATNAICERVGSAETCRRGPIRMGTIKAVAPALFPPAS